MSGWVQIVLVAAALATAIGVLWTKVLHPLIRFSASADVMLPLLHDLTATFRDTPQAFAILDQIIAQFRSDSGSTLRDVINRLEKAAEDNRHVGEALKVGAKTAEELAKQDRDQLKTLVRLLDLLIAREVEAAKARTRIEEAAAKVADDLAASHRRADEVKDGKSGDAADAASQQTTEERGRP